MPAKRSASTRDPRPIWSGVLSFGLLNIPVRLFASTQSKPGLNLDYVRTHDRCPVGYQYVCKDTGESVAYADISRAYELPNGDHVLVTEDDYQQAGLEQSQSLQITQFTTLDNIPPHLLHKPYYLAPDADAQAMYALLYHALTLTDRVAIVQYILRHHQHLGLILAQPADPTHPDTQLPHLSLIQLRYPEEIKPLASLDLPENITPEPQQLELAQELIERYTQPFNPNRYQNTYLEELKRILEQKAQGQLKRRSPRPPKPTSTRELFERLRQSLEATPPSAYL